MVVLEVRSGECADLEGLRDGPTVRKPLDLSVFQKDAVVGLSVPEEFLSLEIAERCVCVPEGVGWLVEDVRDGDVGGDGDRKVSASLQFFLT